MMKIRINGIKKLVIKCVYFLYTCIKIKKCIHQAMAVLQRANINSKLWGQYKKYYYKYI